MWAASPAVTDLSGINCGPDVGARQLGHEQRCPTRAANNRLVGNENSSSLISARSKSAPRYWESPASSAGYTAQSFAVPPSQRGAAHH